MKKISVASLQKIQPNLDIVQKVFIPAVKPPFLFSKPGVRYRLEYLRSAFASMYCAGIIKRQFLPKWKPNQFGLEAQDLYVKINKAYAENDREALKKVLGDNMLSSMRVKGKQTYTFLGPIARPKVLSIQYGKIDEHKGFAHVVVRLHAKHSFKETNGKESTNTVQEDIVLTRPLGFNNSHWRMIGYAQDAQ